jgi:Uma2 family endonuclease
MLLTEPAIKNKIPQWQPATWEDYLRYRDDLTKERVRIFFDDNNLWIDEGLDGMGAEGINHAKVSDLITLLIGFWFSRFTEPTAESLGRCLLEKPKTRAAAPDIVLYIGEGIPQWREGEPRRIDLSQWRVPDLVGEIADTTLATDLDEKKKIYANLAIPEYWVIDVQGERIFAFQLDGDGKYQQCTESTALPGLPIYLIEQALQQLREGTNISVATWFSQAIANL